MRATAGAYWAARAALRLGSHIIVEPRRTLTIDGVVIGKLTRGQLRSLWRFSKHIHEGYANGAHWRDLDI